MSKTQTYVLAAVLSAVLYAVVRLIMVTANETQPARLSPVPETSVIKITKVVYAAESVVVQKPKQDEIEAYIRTIFGHDAKVAIAISRAECNPNHPQYPACTNYVGRDHSVGIFQINLKAHAGKVPGATLTEKEDYLKDPYHNTLIAKSIFADSGFGPWSTYTNGTYKQNLSL